MIKLVILSMLFVSASLNAQQYMSINVPDLPESSRFGAAVDIQEGRAMISAPGQRINDNAQQGAVYVFEIEPEFVQTRMLVASDGTAYNSFGTDLAIGGGMYAVSAPDKGFGAVYIFEESGTEIVEKQIIRPEDEHMRAQPFLNYGKAIAISGNHLFISAPAYRDNGGIRTGAVFIHELIDGTWQYSGVLIPDQQTSAEFGRCMAAGDNRILIGAPTGDGGAEKSGIVYLYELQGETWELVHQFIYPDSYPHEMFGTSVDIDGERVIIGSLMHVFDEAEGPIGAAHIYDFSGSTWIHTTTLRGEDSERNDMFSESVALEQDVVVVGSARSDHSGLTDAGSIYIFVLVDGIWKQIERLLPDMNDGQHHMYFGGELAIMNYQLVIGAHLHDDLNDDSGNAFVYDLGMTVSVEDDENLQAEVFQIIPNPFSESVEIRFQLERTAPIRFEVFNLDGRKVDEIREQIYPGNHMNAVTWQGTGLPDGIYFISMRSGKSRVSKSVIKS